MLLHAYSVASFNQFHQLQKINLLPLQIYYYYFSWFTARLGRFMNFMEALLCWRRSLRGTTVNTCLHRVFIPIFHSTALLVLMMMTMMVPTTKFANIHCHSSKVYTMSSSQSLRLARTMCGALRFISISRMPSTPQLYSILPSLSSFLLLSCTRAVLLRLCLYLRSFLTCSMSEESSSRACPSSCITYENSSLMNGYTFAKWTHSRMHDG